MFSFDEAASICTPSDKLPIRAAAYLRGRIKESEGNIKEALKEYAISGPNGPEILRIALHKGDLSVIFNAANDGNTDPQLHLWLGRYYEYKKQYDTALTHYDLCGELRESVRLLCLMTIKSTQYKKVHNLSNLKIGIHIKTLNNPSILQEFHLVYQILGILRLYYQ